MSFEVGHTKPEVETFSLDELHEKRRTPTGDIMGFNYPKSELHKSSQSYNNKTTIYKAQ